MKYLKDIKRSAFPLYAYNDKVSFPLNLSVITYASRVDLENEMYAEFGEECSFPTINELIAEGKLETKSFLNTHDIYFHEKVFCRTNSKCPYMFPKKNLERVINEFKEHGFNVTEEAIQHNYNAWLYDLKSGYRDEENGYHLFTPCGCNPLSFRATNLDDEFCKDWQTTYEC